MGEEAVDVQDSGAVEVDAVEVGANLVARDRADQYSGCDGWIDSGESHLGPYLLW